MGEEELFSRLSQQDIRELRAEYVDLLGDKEQIETPSDPFNRLVLNPRSEDEAGNPLCPECEDPIVPWANQHERRFNCGCDGLRRFSFKRGEGDE